MLKKRCIVQRWSGFCNWKIDFNTKNIEIKKIQILQMFTYRYRRLVVDITVAIRCRSIVVLDRFQLLLAQMGHDRSTKSVAKHIDHRSETIPEIGKIKSQIDISSSPNSHRIQKPIDGDNQRHILSRQTDGVQNHDQGDESSLWDASRSYCRRCCGYTNRHDVAKG
jgi:hypothetical protein